VIQILNAFNGPDDGAGVTTSGGTESIIMACLAAREKAAAERGITSPEMYVIVCVSVLTAVLIDQDNSKYRSCGIFQGCQLFQD
jgi:hypothetical protein